MGFIRNLFAGRTADLEAVATGQGPDFATSIDSGVLYGTPTLDDYIYGRVGGKISRREAITVPSVLRGRNLVAGPIGTLPMRLSKPADEPVEWALLDQPEPDTAPSVTWTNVADDLLFHGRAWLLVTHRGWHGKPAVVKRLDPETVTIDAYDRVWRTRHGSGVTREYLADDRVIRIDSPTEPLLSAGATAIRTCLALARSTRNVAAGLPPSTYFTPAEGSDYLDRTEIQQILDDWHAARSKNVTGYVPAALDLKSLGWNPEQLQLKDLRDQAVLDIARLFGVDAEELGVSTTSRTYFNAWDRKQDFIQFTLAPYLSAIEGRLSMDDVTPHGYRVRFDLDEFFKADTLARFQAYEVGLRTGAMTLDEIRAAEGRPALTPAQVAAVAELGAARTEQPETETANA